MRKSFSTSFRCVRRTVRPVGKTQDILVRYYSVSCDCRYSTNSTSTANKALREHIAISQALLSQVWRPRDFGPCKPARLGSAWKEKAAMASRFIVTRLETMAWPRRTSTRILRSCVKCCRSLTRVRVAHRQGATAALRRTRIVHHLSVLAATNFPGSLRL